jgi:hypothetical protein
VEGAERLGTDQFGFGQVVRAKATVNLLTATSNQRLGSEVSDWSKYHFEFGATLQDSVEIMAEVGLEVVWTPITSPCLSSYLSFSSDFVIPVGNFLLFLTCFCEEMMYSYTNCCYDGFLKVFSFSYSF